MGYMRHDAIIVTQWDLATLKKLRDKAIELGLVVTDIVKSPRNSYATFVVVPDGSKEGWDFSDEFDKKREEYKNWLIAVYDDMYPDWIHVNYGGDEPDCAHIVGKRGDQKENE